jgi:hypothetical protein
MAGYNKILDFVEQLGLTTHNLNTHTLKVALVRSTDPIVNTDTILANVTQPTGTNYAPIDTQNSWAESPAGTGTLTGTKCVFTAGAADWQSFKYVALYNDDTAVLVDPLICWWDYGTDLVLGNGETFSVKFNSSDTQGTILTLT